MFSVAFLWYITSLVVQCYQIFICLSCLKWPIYMLFVVIILLLIRSRLCSLLQDSPTTIDILFGSHQCCWTHQWLMGENPLLSWWHCLCYLNLYYCLDCDMVLSDLNKVGVVWTTCHVACTDLGCRPQWSKSGTDIMRWSPGNTFAMASICTLNF